MKKKPRGNSCALEPLESRVLLSARSRRAKAIGPSGASSPANLAALSVGSAYVVPTNPQTVMDLDPGWKFSLNPTGTPQNTNFNDSSWAGVSLPHTWNANSSTSGTGWYRTILPLPAALKNGPELYLHFEGAYSVTSLYIDGTQIDYNPNASGVQAHGGGFAAFDFDVTTALNAAVPAGLTGHLIAVAENTNSNAGVSGTADSSVSPNGGGDYVHQGGMYRDVSLIATQKTHVALQEKDPNTNVPVSGGGVYFTTTSAVVIGATSANIAATTVLDNQAATAQTVSVISYLVDAAGVIRSQTSSSLAVPGSQTTAVAATPTALVQTSTVANPHLWDGRIDPYLYDLYVEVRDGSNVLLDLSHQKVGIRSFQFIAQPTASQAPFNLNGHAYTLVGADVHQDSGVLDASGNPVGWAQSDAQIQADVDMAVPLGITVIRTSHYQENQAFYSACDRAGIMVYTEDGTNGTLNTTNLNNTLDQLSELIKQNYNHPSVFAFGLANETDGAAASLFTTLNTLAHSLDQLQQYTATIARTHMSAIASSPGAVNAATAVPDIKGSHRYDYWYGTTTSLVSLHNSDLTQPLGITEMGGGASAYQYTDNGIVLPVGNQTGGVNTHYHPSNQQTRIEAAMWTDLLKPSLNFVWGKIIWQMFDMPDFKTEGDLSGQNDKGLVTRARVKKDSYYFYQAQWNDPTRNYDSLKVIHLSDQYWTTRNSPTATVTAYSNLGAPTLYVNGVAIGTMTPLSVLSNGAIAGVASGNEIVPNAYTLTLSGANVLAVGNNSIQASVVYGGSTYSDSTTWTYYNAADFGAGTPVATGVSVNRTFTYDQLLQTTANPFTMSLANGVYDVRITSPSGGANNLSLQGQTAAIDTNGLAAGDTYYARFTVTNGQLTLAAAPGAFNASVTSLDINRIAPPAVSAATINGGAAQRSVISSLALQFTEKVVAQPGAVSLGLRKTSGSGYSTTYALLAANPSGDGINYAFTLASGANLNTLGDGVYDLNVDPTLVSDTSGMAMQAPFTSTFHRLFGDSNGDKYVDNADLFQFRASYLRGAAAYNPIFDFDQNGVVDGFDLTAFKTRLGTHLVY